jgi:dihydropyrimidinase
MAELATVIRGVDAVLPNGRAVVDLGFSTEGTIAAIERAGTIAGDTMVDAAGMIALPGGIDLHVHIQTFFGGTTTRDDFVDGTIAALFGGTTTIAQFAIPRQGETSQDAVTRTHLEADGRALADYAIHGCVVRDSYVDSVAQFPELRSSGVGTVKVFSAYTDVIGLDLDQIRELLSAAARSGLTVFVHAEDDSMIRKGIDDAVQRSELGPLGHAASRTPAAEVDAIRTISDLAADTGATVYFVHVSAAQSVATLADRRDRGERVLAETCPHYLFLDDSVYGREYGERWICSPPIRAAEHQDALWAGLRAGVIDAVSSDHNCFDSVQKGSSADDFRACPNGLPGVESRIPLLIGAAIEGRLEWTRLAQVAAETPARILGLSKTKGALLVGADADVVLVDPAGETHLDAGHMSTDHSPFDGMHVRGRIERVYRRGDLVVQGDELHAARGSGSWLRVPGLSDVGSSPGVSMTRG